uniref:Uncharacterized protein n=1 Tax=Amphimedon queenslandica TaxID=400682 RepID=A0A1X7V9W2_AMPQE
MDQSFLVLPHQEYVTKLFHQLHCKWWPVMRGHLYKEMPLPYHSFHLHLPCLPVG